METAVGALEWFNRKVIYMSSLEKFIPSYQQHNIAAHHTPIQNGTVCSETTVAIMHCVHTLRVLLKVKEASSVGWFLPSLDLG